MLQIQTHAKIGIWVGIVAIIISMTFFTIHESQELKYQYGRLFVDPQEMYNKLAERGTVEVFTKKFPYFYEEFEIRRDGSSSLQLFAMNNQTGNQLNLRVNFDQDDDKIRERVNCNFNDRFYRTMEASISLDSDRWGNAYPEPEPFNPYLNGNARDRFVIDFINNTECLEDMETILSNMQEASGTFLNNNMGSGAGSPILEPIREPTPGPVIIEN